VVGTASEDARTEPLELLTGCDRVRLAIELPTAIRDGEEPEGLTLAEVGLAAVFGASVRVVVRSLVFLEIARRIQHGTGFQKSDVHTQVSKDFDHGSATSTRADDDDVVDRAATNDLHVRRVADRREERRKYG
jgi:hypothetical protein